jgi:antitoxin ParD1/3/4
MNIALTKHFEDLIARLVASGRYNNSSEVVRAGLRILDDEERSVAAGSCPPGSLRRLYSPADNRAERRTAKASTLKVEAQRNSGASGLSTSPKRDRIPPSS